MKKILLRLTILVLSVYGYGQIPTYYNDVNLSLTGQALKNELGSKVTNTQSVSLSYTPGVWNALMQTDIAPTNSSKVVLIYGFNDSDGDSTTDRTRGINDNGGGTTDWNREHVYPRSLGNPNLGSTGPGSDIHHLRPADVRRNSNRGNRKFADGSGNSRVTSQGYWYPGDEFKGDVARMMMFMYIRYGNRCLPTNVGIGSVVSNDVNMIDLFLEWNAEDPVSSLELQRNPIAQGLQGNRNPFIDNPAFATQIWGGPQAEDRFGNSNGGGNTLCSTTITSFPYNESFENTLGDWKQARSADDFNWSIRSGNTPSSNTGPNAASSGSYYAYMESSTPNNPNKRAILFSPCYDIPTTVNRATFSFRYHLYGASTMGSLSLQASLNGNSWTSIWSVSGNQGNSWKTATVDLSAYLGKKVQLRFNGVTGTTWQGDMAIDQINLTTSTSTGGEPSVLDVNLRITFDNYPEETSWEIRNDNNQLVYSGGTYTSQADGSTINISRSLEEGCYTFIINDTFGDGICCTYGNGSYALTDSSNITLLSGGDFNAQESKNFCIGSNSRSFVDDEDKNSKTTTLDFDIYPNPVKNVLIIKNVKIPIHRYMITNHMGQLVNNGEMLSKQIEVNSLPIGMYFLTLIYDEKTVTKKFIKE